MKRVGCAIYFRDEAPAALYKSPSSSRPKWMRNRSDEVRTTRDGVRYIRSIGWELKPENRMYTTCARFTVVTTKWRR